MVFRMLLTGDVMIGRGIDQILPFSCNPRIYEPNVNDAREYVKLAEIKNGPIPKIINFEYIWGNALKWAKKEKLDLNLINLETALTKNERFWTNKEVHYRCHPKNVEALKIFKVNCCNLANNHILDWCYEGLFETTKVLSENGIKFSGTGRNLKEALNPLIVNFSDNGKVIVMGVGSVSSGILPEWAVTKKRPGILVLESFKNFERTLNKILKKCKQEEDIAILSIHWGENWGFQIHEWQRKLAHKLIESSGIDLIHGHSSHHFKGFEIYKDKLILYGCGDFINDYEGIPEFLNFRDDLTLMYLPELDFDGNLVRMRLIPFKIEKMRLRETSKEEFKVVKEILTREEEKFGIDIKEKGNLFLLKF